MRQHGFGANRLYRKHSVSDGAFCKWRPMHSGMDVLDAKKLKTLKVEGAKAEKVVDGTAE